MSSEAAPDAAIDFEAAGICRGKLVRLDGHVTGARGAIDLGGFARIAPLADPHVR